jgi:hypothetical protein
MLLRLMLGGSSEQATAIQLWADGTTSSTELARCRVQPPRGNHAVLPSSPKAGIWPGVTCPNLQKWLCAQQFGFSFVHVRGCKA